MRFFAYLTFWLLLLVDLGLASSKLEQTAATIALVAPMSGDLAKTGNEIRQAVQFYIDDANQKASINGTKINLLVYDDQGSAEIAEKIAKTIAAETNTSLVISNFLLENTASLSKVYAELKLPVITASVSEEKEFSN